MQASYYISNKDHPNGIQGFVQQQQQQRRGSGPGPAALPLLPSSSSASPPPLKPPRFPAAAKTSLASMAGGILVTRFACEQECRSWGICVHYQFCCGVRSCADGLVCERCVGGVVPQKDVTSRRKCPMHQDPREKGWVPSLREDFLATDGERERCAERLMRSRHGLWDMGSGAGGSSAQPSQRLRGGVVGKRSWMEDAEDSAVGKKQKSRVGMARRPVQWERSLQLE